MTCKTTLTNVKRERKEASEVECGRVLSEYLKTCVLSQVKRDKTFIGDRQADWHFGQSANSFTATILLCIVEMYSSPFRTVAVSTYFQIEIGDVR